MTDPDATQPPPQVVELERSDRVDTPPHGATWTRAHQRIPYEPALDGLRGIAVVAVVLYHLDVAGHDLPWARGGFLGVDAFFVLSGFLITSLLLVEWRETGRISLRDFWSRRARRLLPALFLVVAFVAAYAVFAAEPTELETIRSDGLATLLYVSNWHFVIEDVSYFDQFLLPSPFQHMWSLAIEEQWYLIWPVVLIGVLAWRRSLRAVAWVTGGLCAASVAWMVVIHEPGDPSRAYFGTDTRAQSLLVGALLATALINGLDVGDRTARYIVPALALVAGAGIGLAWSTTPDTAEWLYTGGFFLLAAGVALIILASVQPQDNLVRRGLSWEPLRLLGVISYGIYLWHWPLFVVIRPDVVEQYLHFRPSGPTLLLLRVAATLAAATASYLLIERPIRWGALRDRVSFSPMLLPASAVLVLVLVLSSTDDAVSPPDVATASAPGARPVPTLESLGPDAATLGDGTKVLLVGDSVANSLAEGFSRDLQADSGVLLWDQTVLFCELAEGPRQEDGEEVDEPSICDDWQAAWTTNIDEYDPEVVVLGVGAWEVFDRKIDGEWMVYGTPEFDEYLLAQLGDAIAVLAQDGATVVVLTAPRFERRDSVSAGEWTMNEQWRTDHLNELFEQAVAESDGKAVIVDLGEFLCPGGDDCLQTLEDGTEVRYDGVHFGEEGATMIAGWLAPMLRDAATAP